MLQLKIDERQALKSFLVTLTVYGTQRDINIYCIQENIAGL